MNTATPEELLARYEHFDECIIEDVVFSHYQSSLAITLNYIWQAHGIFREDLSTPKLVQVVFRLVQEVRFANGLNNPLLDEPHEMGWGINEVAWVSVVDDPDLLSPYQHLNRPFRHVNFDWYWENRRIDVVFAEMEIIEL